MNNQPSSVVAIIGAGPAGLSAALWLSNLGLTPVIIDQSSATGGMLNVNFLTNDWVLGHVGMTGPEMATCYDQHVKNKKVDIRLTTRLQSIHRHEEGFCLTLQCSDSDNTANPPSLTFLHCNALLIATGTRYVDKNILPISVLDVAAPYIVEGPYTFADIEKQCQKTIVIVGGGDNAFENASLLLERDCRVVLVVRSMSKAQRKFFDPVSVHPNARILEGAHIVSASRIDSALSVDIATDNVEDAINSSSITTIPHVHHIHILAGYQANSESVVRCVAEGLQENIACDEKQFLRVDRFGRTNVSGIYAAGDICNTDFPSVVSAVSSGASVAKTISQDISGAFSAIEELSDS